MSVRWRDLAELVRAPAALSVPGDVIAGAAAAKQLGPRTAGLAGASVLLYWAGMAANDWADREVDAKERPERPIPSGRVQPGTALGVATGLTAAAMVTAGLTGGRKALAVAIPLAGAVWAYDLKLKTPALMAACRALNVLLGANGNPRKALAPAAIVFAHTYTVTALSQSEVDGATPDLPRRTLAATAAVALAAAAGGAFAGGTPARETLAAETSVGETLAAGTPAKGTPAARMSAWEVFAAGMSVREMFAAGGSIRGTLAAAASAREVLAAGASVRGTLAAAASAREVLAAGTPAKGTLAGKAPAAGALTAGALAAWYAVRYGRPQLDAIREPDAAHIQRAVGAGILNLPALQGALTARAGKPLLGLAVAAASVLATRLARKVKPT